jgi:membrane-associated phospholipid phosphatase
MPRGARIALIGAATGLALLFVIWYAAFHVGVVEHADQSILHGFAGLRRPRVDRITRFIANLCDPVPYVYFAAVPVLVALARRRPRVAAVVAMILLGANVTTQLLKPLLASPRATTLFGYPEVAPASWPSGHATAAMSLTLCAVIVAPSRLRPFVAALGAAFAVAVCYSFLELGWHYPSDVFGGFLVATTWTFLGVSVLYALPARRARPATGLSRELAKQVSVREALGPPAAVAIGALTLAGLLVLERPHAVVAYARAHEAFMIGATAIAALGLALTTGVMLALRQGGQAAPATGSARAPRGAPGRDSHRG